MQRTLPLVLFLLVQFPGGLPAQSVTGTILGSVSDSSGARISGAGVVAIDQLTQEKHATVTNATGDYLITALPVGQYRIVFEVQGFKKHVRQGVALDVNQNARVDARLELGQLSQEVVVSGNAASVDTHEVQLGGVVDTQRINDLPLNGRNIYGLATLLPGVAAVSLQSQPDVATGTEMSVNGSRLLQTSFLLDGSLNNNVFHNGGLQSPNPDAVDEFRLITSNYNAEYGRSAGGVVNVITKSGTNQFHASLFEYLRNTDLDARSYFQSTTADLKQNQYGGTVGGPIKHDKLFFFFSYQGTPVHSGEFVNVARTPTAAERAGNFSSLPASQQPKDPNTAPAQPFSGGIIPTSRLDPVAQNILGLIALPNTPDGRVQDSEAERLNDNEYLAKGDYLLNAANRITISTYFVRTNDLYPFSNQTASTNIPKYQPIANQPSQNNVSASETWTITRTLLNQFQFSRASGASATINQDTKSLPDFGSKITLQTQYPSPPKMQVINGWAGTASGNLTELDQIYSWSDQLSWVKGPHSLKFGGLAEYFLYDYYSGASAPGTIIVSGAFSGNNFADFELGRVQFGAGAPFVSHLKSYNLGLFAQDDWKVSRKITLNLGLRYEIFSQFTDASNQLSDWIPGQRSQRIPNAPLGMNFVGDTGVPPGLVPTRYGNFAPRVGLAIDPFGNGKTAIRAGFGIFYSTGFAGLTNANIGQPFSASASIPETQSLVNPYSTLATPFPPPAGVYSFTLPVTVPWMNQNNVTPYVEQYNFTVEQQLRKNLTLTAAYVGNVSRHLQFNRDANAPIFIPGQSTVANVNSRRPVEPGIISGIFDAETGANADYNALQMTLNRRLSHGVTLLANYTYSKALDIQDADQLTVTTNTFVYSNNLALDRGPANFDKRNILSLSALWVLPNTRAWGFVGKQILSNWQINAIAGYSSGNPFNITSGTDTNLDGNNNDRPNLIANPAVSSKTLAEYFNTAAFKAPAATSGLNGTLGRNVLYGPGSENWDLSFFKAFTLHENHRLQLRTEMFNAFNHANFGSPVAVVSNPNFGQILGAGAGRVIQFGLKYSF